MAGQIIDRARFELAYWLLLWPGFTLCNEERCYRAGIAWLRTVRPIAESVSPGCLRT
jgi:hypothetical protein